jgi:hypothetical protein
MKIIDSILNSTHFTNHPPVLIDIGASGEINEKWRSIARYSICLAFDADDREFHQTEETNREYKKLIIFNRIVTAEPTGNHPFYLTASPFCSSLLQPDTEKLEPWLFKPLFEITKITTFPTITLQQSLIQAGITYIDWFKADTQGTDLRLFNSLPDLLKENVLIAEFEPGILDAYKGEDKLHSVMKEMQNMGFWLSSMKIKGTQRLHSDYSRKIGPFLSKRILRTSPGWSEISYLKEPNFVDHRKLLLLIVFAMLERQYGFALEVADAALKHFSDSLFHDSKKAAISKIQSEKRKIPFVILKRKINKLFANIND